MRWLVVSLVVHAALLAWFARGDEQRVRVRWPSLPKAEHVETTVVELIDEPGGGGSRGTSSVARSSHFAGHSVAQRSSDPWQQIDVSMEAGGGRDSGDGEGNGIGDGHGNGNGIGLGAGLGGIHVATDVPAPPPAPKISKARPAKLVWPTRDEDVADPGDLFIAKVTVDIEGSVVGARMLQTRPGAKAEHAESAIWTFRYDPALDDDGRPIRSTFEQPFQVR